MADHKSLQIFQVYMVKNHAHFRCTLYCSLNSLQRQTSCVPFSLSPQHLKQRSVKSGKLTFIQPAVPSGIPCGSLSKFEK